MGKLEPITDGNLNLPNELLKVSKNLDSDLNLKFQLLTFGSLIEQGSDYKVNINPQNGDYTEVYKAEFGEIISGNTVIEKTIIPLLEENKVIGIIQNYPIRLEVENISRNSYRIKILDELGLHKYCCRRMMLSNVHLISYIS